jgi:predicted Zn-dependent peptidase
MNTELDRYQQITVEDLKEAANEIFDEANSSTIHYFSRN